MLGGTPDTLITPCELKCNARINAAQEAQSLAYEEQMSLSNDLSTGQLLGVVVNARNIAKPGWASVGHVLLGLVAGMGGGYLWHGLKKTVFHHNHHNEPNSR